MALGWGGIDLSKATYEEIVRWMVGGPFCWQHALSPFSEESCPASSLRRCTIATEELQQLIDRLNHDTFSRLDKEAEEKK